MIDAGETPAHPDYWIATSATPPRNDRAKWRKRRPDKQCASGIIPGFNRELARTNVGLLLFVAASLAVDEPDCCCFTND
jgi:hypothetical protein